MEQKQGCFKAVSRVEGFDDGAEMSPFGGCSGGRENKMRASLWVASFCARFCVRLSGDERDVEDVDSRGTGISAHRI